MAKRAQETMEQAAEPLNRKGRHLSDMGYFLWRPWATTKLMLGWSFPADFRERLMLAVTQVNQCRLCSWAHTRAALRAGLEQSEIEGILHAEFDDTPEDQRVAVLFAQQWAHTQGAVDAEALARLEQHYDGPTRANILLSIRFINAMNGLMGRFGA